MKLLSNVTKQNKKFVYEINILKQGILCTLVVQLEQG